jgi:hypothetical protein
MSLWRARSIVLERESQNEWVQDAVA